MTSAIQHRGPDDEGSYVSNGIFLGHRRLSIVDIAGGAQPMWNAARTQCIVYNGELYNTAELRSELEAHGCRFSTRSDTEVVLEAFSRWGIDSLKKLNGMFAFAVWDANARSLHLVRDRVGEKPLYYYQDDQRIVFGSEIKAIVADRSVPRELDPRGLSNFLAFGRASAPNTIYKNIKKLQPGHYLVADEAGVRTAKYWDIGPVSAGSEKVTEEEWAGRILSTLDDSVHRRMVADVPIGAFLSGGVDSSAIVALMKRHATGPVKTFSLGFVVGGGYNELADAKKVATELNTDHHELLVQDLDLPNVLQKLVYHYDEPFNDAACVPLYLLSQFASQHVKVVLSGDGGDELFGGYRRYAVDRLAEPYQYLPKRLIESWLPALANKLPRLRRSKRALRVLSIQDAARRYAEWLTLFTPEMQQELLRPEILSAIGQFDPSAAMRVHYASRPEIAARDHVNRLMYVDFKTLLPDMYLEKTDKATMASGLEGRLPFLDHRLVELAFDIPGRLKIQGMSTKKILKRALTGLVPPYVLTKPKHGFAVPTDNWFRGSATQFAFDILLDDRTKRRRIFNTAMVERMRREHAEGRECWHGQLWALLNFELWSRTYLDTAV